MAFLKTDTVKLLKETYIQLEGNELHLKFDFVDNNINQSTSHETREYIIDNEIVFQVRVISVAITHQYYYNSYGRNYYQELSDGEINLNIFYLRGRSVVPGHYKTFKWTSLQLGTINFPLDVSTEPTWYLIGLYKKDKHTFIEFKIELQEDTPSSFATLYDDTVITDFELRGDDGSVSVHRAVLAAASPVLKTMLEGTWKETTDGGVKIPNTSRATLQLLKQYLYLNVLPEEDVENLLLLASCYMMDDLKEKCMGLLVDTLTAENIYNRMEFAVQNAMKRLLVMILKRVQAGDVKVDQIQLQ